MRKALLLALALAAVAALAAPALAQPPLLEQAFQVRGGFGDIRTTEAVEPAGAWNLVQSLRVPHTQGTASNTTFHVPAGHAVLAPGCSCPAFESATSGLDVTILVPAGTASGNVTASLTTTAQVDEAFGFILTLPDRADAADVVAVLYVPVASDIAGPVAATSPGLSTDGQSRIFLFEGTAQAPWPPQASFFLAPATATAPPPVDAPTGEGDGFAWLELALGIAIGAALWALLVQRGLVQAQARPPATTGAAPAEAGAAEPRPVLEGRKRALLAALKELELARQAQEVPVEAYEVVKADLKRQAVAVMQALAVDDGASPPASPTAPPLE